MPGVVAGPDPFLRGDQDSVMIGGASRPNSRVRPPADPYAFSEPDVNFRAATDDSFADGTEVFRPVKSDTAGNVRPGNTGGVPFSSTRRVRKSIKPGLFSRIVFGR